MIRTEAGLQSTHDALMNLQMILWGLFQDKAKYGKGYPIITEAWAGEIFKLRKEIDDMIGLTDYVAEFGVPMTDEEIYAQAASTPFQPSVNGTARASPIPTPALS